MIQLNVDSKARIASDYGTENKNYPDYLIENGINLIQMNSRFYFNALLDINYYTSSVNLNLTYPNTDQYNISAKILNTDKYLNRFFNITNCKLKI